MHHNAIPTTQYNDTNLSETASGYNFHQSHASYLNYQPSIQPGLNLVGSPYDLNNQHEYTRGVLQYQITPSPVWPGATIHPQTQSNRMYSNSRTQAFDGCIETPMTFAHQLQAPTEENSHLLSGHIQEQSAVDLIRENHPEPMTINQLIMMLNQQSQPGFFRNTSHNNVIMNNQQMKPLLNLIDDLFERLCQNHTPEPCVLTISSSRILLSALALLLKNNTIDSTTFQAERLVTCSMPLIHHILQTEKGVQVEDIILLTEAIGTLAEHKLLTEKNSIQSCIDLLCGLIHSITVDYKPPIPLDHCVKMLQSIHELSKNRLIHRQQTINILSPLMLMMSSKISEIPKHENLQNVLHVSSTKLIGLFALHMVAPINSQISTIEVELILKVISIRIQEPLVTLQEASKLLFLAVISLKKISPDAYHRAISSIMQDLIKYITERQDQF